MTAIGGNWKDLLKASGEGDLALIRYHLNQGVDPNYQHPEYFTCPIFEAIRNGQKDAIQLLVEQGKADCSLLEDLTDQTPVEVALQEKQWDVIEYLNTQLPPQQQWKPKHVLVTGGNRGIGKAICAKLVQEGHVIVFTCRSQQAGDITRRELLETLDPSIRANNNRSFCKIDYIVGDLSTIESTRILAKQIKTEFPTMNVLIHNAGIWPTTKQVNEDGLEMAFMVHYMAPVILTQELMSTLEKNGPHSRIILVHAKLYVFGKANLAETPFGHDFHPFKTYMHTKQCGIYFLLNQARRFKEKQQSRGNNNNGKIVYPVTINAIHPGVFRTGLGESTTENNVCFNGCLRFVKRFWKPASLSADGVVWLATSEETNTLQGEYLDGKTSDPIPSELLHDTAKQKEWEQWSMDFLSKHDDKLKQKNLANDK